MNTRRISCLFLCIGSAVIGLLLLTTFLGVQASGAKTLPEILPAEAIASVLTEAPSQIPGAYFIVSPDPPMAGEPTELRVILFNPGDTELVRYAQFSVTYFGLGMQLQPITDRRPFILPPHAEGFTQITWIPPSGAGFGYVVDIYAAPDALVPILSLSRNVRLLVHPDPGLPQTIQVVTIPLRNPLPDSTLLTLTLPIPPEASLWQAAIQPQEVALGPGEIILAHAVFTYTGGGQIPPSGVQEFKVEAFAQGMPVGYAQLSFGSPVQLHLRAEPRFAESEISVNPYPVNAGEPTELCAAVRNVTFEPRQAFVFFRVGPFGIAMPFAPVAPPIEVMIPPLGMQRPCIQWVPPQAGQFAVQVWLETPGYPRQVSSQRVIDAGELLLPGTTASITFPVSNPFGQPVTIALTTDPYVSWNMVLDPPILAGMGPGETKPVTLIVHVPPSGTLPADGQTLVDVQAFVGPDPIGGFRKVYRPPVPIHIPADPIYAEREIKVFPYPPQAHQPTEICVELRNPTEVTQTMIVDFNVAEFGIGMPWHQIGLDRQVTIAANGMAFPCLNWVPPFGGRFGVEIGIRVRGHERIFSQRVIDVGEVLLPNQPSDFEFPVRNPTSAPLTVTLNAIRYLPQWQVSFDPAEFVLGPYAVTPLVMHVTPVQQPGDPEPREGEPVIDVEAYAQGELIGGFRKLFYPPVPVHILADPPYAEREIQIFPYPPQAGEPTHLLFFARNPTDLTQQISVTFEVGYLGIGLPFQAIASPTVLNLPPGGIQVAEVWWVPPVAGEFCVRVKVDSPGFTEPFYSARNISVIRLPHPYGQPEVFQFAVGDGGNTARPLTVTLGLRTLLPGWQVGLASEQIVLQAGQSIATGVMTITPPVDPAELSFLVDGAPVVDVSGYVNGELVGGIRKVWRPPVPLGQIGEPTYAESEIGITPDPPQAGVTTVFTAELRNLSDFTQTLQVQFGWADFGFGIPFTTTNVTPTQTIVHLGPHQVTTITSSWKPVTGGHYCIQIRLKNLDTGENVLSQRNVDVIRVPEDSCQSFTKKFLLQNSTGETVTVTLGSNAINLPPGWDYTVTPTMTVLGPYESITVTLVITPPCTLTGLVRSSAIDPTQPTRIQVEGYTYEGVLVGGVEMQLLAAVKYELYLPWIAR